MRPLGIIVCVSIGGLSFREGYSDQSKTGRCAFPNIGNAQLGSITSESVALGDRSLADDLEWNGVLYV